MKVFVAGSDGMLASDLIPVLERSHCVIKGDLPDFDVTYADSVSIRLHEVRPDAVINCAAYTAVDKAEEESDLAYAVNCKGVENLANACRQSGSRLIHISTDYVFDGKANRPYHEDDAPNPQNVYGKSKLAGEERIKEIMEDYLIVRTSWLYGRHGGNFVNTISSLAKERKALSVVFDQAGSPTYTKDLSVAIKKLLEKSASGIYHFSNEGVCSWYDFACEIVRQMEINNIPFQVRKISPVLSGEFPKPAARPAYSVLDKTRYKKATSEEIPHWRDGLERYFRED